MAQNNPIASLMLSVKPMRPSYTVAHVGEQILLPENQRHLSLPVVSDDGMPQGVISRHAMQNVYMTLYGRDLYGRRPVEEIMNERPLMVPAEMSLEEASRYITENVTYPITEDFIITDQGRYAGVGIVVDLLKAMDDRVRSRNQELARAYRSLKSSQAQLVQSEKMASLGQMVAGVAHEINTPLGYVKNNVQLKWEMFAQTRGLVASYERFFDALFSGEVADEEMEGLAAGVQGLRVDLGQGETIAEMEQLFSDTLYGIEQISEMVLNLKNFSRLDQAQLSNVDLNECIDSALLIAKNVIKHKAEVIREYGELPPLSCSPSQINQVFLNLLTNAAQAIEGSGKIQIRTWAEGGRVFASVQDTGKGIPKEALARIFDPFFTTKPIGEGTGLGLSIVYKIVQGHKGEIKVASRPGVGTRFLLSFPEYAVELKEAS